MIDVLSQFQKFEPLKGRLFRGTVVFVDDQRKLGRIKVTIPNVLPWGEDEVDKLPWIYPLYPAGLGIHPLSTYFCVPLLRSDVLVMFLEDLPYFGFYLYSTTDRRNRMEDFHSEYPYRYGYSDPIGNKKIVNLWTQTTEKATPDGAFSTHNFKEKVYRYFGKNTKIEIRQEDKYFKVEYDELRIVYDKGSLTINCPRLSIDFQAVNILVNDLVSLVGDELNDT